MRTVAFTLTAAALLASPALAEPWKTDYQMGTFVAYGGSDAEGWISLECGSLQSGHNWGGKMYVEVTPATGSVPEGLKVKSLLLTAGPRQSGIRLPVTREGENFVATSDDIDTELAGALVALLATGDGLRIVTATTPFQDVADMSLQGSAEALAGFEDCTGGG